jgi:hypothetical protein
MIKNKRMKPTYKQVVVEPKVSNPSIHTRSKVTKKHVFKDIKPIKKKYTTN